MLLSGVGRRYLRWCSPCTSRTRQGTCKLADARAPARCARKAQYALAAQTLVVGVHNSAPTLACACPHALKLWLRAQLTSSPAGSLQLLPLPPCISTQPPRPWPSLHHIAPQHIAPPSYVLILHTIPRANQSHPWRPSRITRPFPRTYKMVQQHPVHGWTVAHGARHQTDATQEVLAANGFKCRRPKTLREYKPCSMYVKMTF